MPSRRHEFSKPVRRDALRRSGGHCEAIGKVYGLEPGKRCNAPLSHGVEFDHYPAPATDAGSNTLENCVAVCRSCHARKTRAYDIPMQAKGQRIRDKHQGITGPKHSWPKRKMNERYVPNERQLHDDLG